MEILCGLVGILIGIFLVHKPNKDIQAREALDRVFKRLTAAEGRQDKTDKRLFAIDEELLSLRFNQDKHWPEMNSYREAKQH